MNMKKNDLYLFAIVLLSIGIGYLVGSKEIPAQFNPFRSLNTERLDRLLEYISNDYVDEINTDSLVGKVIEDIVNKLDPHSVYIPASQRQSIAENMQGNFEGIGVSFFMVRDTVSILRVLEGGPSEAAGILAGDKILIADNDTLYQKNYASERIIKILKGPSDTQVALTIFRKSKNETLKIDLKRGKVPLRSVESYYMLADNIGYIKINRFSQTTYEEFESATKSLMASGMTKMILDLRDNPGGYLSAAREISDTFLDKDQTIVITQTNKGKEERSFATGLGIFKEGDLVVLTNGQSASASEIVAGAIQDNDRGWVVGRRTFGKGLVQQQMPLGGGDAIRLTIARYFTPTGRSIQKPYGRDHEAYYNDLNQRIENGEMADENKIPIADSLAFKTPKGRTVYGGGGIVPDVYISNNKSEEEQWNAYVLKSSLVNNFVFNELDKDRGKYENLSEDDLINGKIIDEREWYEGLKEHLEKNGMQLNNADKSIAINSIKAYIGLQLFGDNAYNRINNQDDEFIKQAVQSLDRLGLTIDF
tara:strand:- start:2667 stop:4268 length:1602 start_codon:yes stop_codon:yes gene_type:complete